MLSPTLTYADDYPGDSCTSPRSVSIPGTANGHLVGNGSAPYEEDFFTITLPSEGELHIWSTGYDDDLDAFLYDDSGCSSEIERDVRGGGTTHDIELNHHVGSGGATYKLKIRGWSGDADYILHVEFTPLGGDLQISNIGSASPDPANVGGDVTFELETRNRIRTTHHDIVVEITYSQDVTIAEAFQFHTANVTYGFTCDKTSGFLAAGDKITCTKPNNWTSTSNHKDLRISVQPSNIGTLTQTATITSLADSDPDTSNNSVTSSVTVNPGCTGCDCSFDTLANDSSPGVVIPDLDGATGDVTKCISGTSENDDNDYYNFTVATAGTLQISTSSPNSHNYHMQITSSTQGTLLAYDTDQNRNLTYVLAANEQITIRVKETGNDLDEYQVNFGFTAGTPLIARDNSYTTTAGANISGNFITDDTGSGVDTGLNIVASTTPSSTPTQGTVTINSNGSFIYAPDSNATGSDSFSYTVSDSNGNTATATVTITIGTNFTNGVFLPFTLVTPPQYQKYHRKLRYRRKYRSMPYKEVDWLWRHLSGRQQYIS